MPTFKNSKIKNSPPLHNEESGSLDNVSDSKELVNIMLDEMERINTALDQSFNKEFSNRWFEDQRKAHQA